jgi:putative transposase
MLAGLPGSVESVGDACDDAHAETAIGLYKTECTRDGVAIPQRPHRLPGRPGGHHQRRGVPAADMHWYNNHRLMRWVA